MYEHTIWDTLDMQDFWDFFSWVRFLVFKDEDAGDQFAGEANQGYPPTSPANEIKAWAFVKNLCL